MKINCGQILDPWPVPHGVLKNECNILGAIPVEFSFIIHSCILVVSQSKKLFLIVCNQTEVTCKIVSKCRAYLYLFLHKLVSNLQLHLYFVRSIVV